MWRPEDGTDDEDESKKKEATCLFWQSSKVPMLNDNASDYDF